MTRDEAVASAVKAVEEAESLLRSGHTELSYSWSVIADTWAHVARALDPDEESPYSTWYEQTKARIAAESDAKMPELR